MVLELLEIVYILENRIEFLIRHQVYDSCEEDICRKDYVQQMSAVFDKGSRFLHPLVVTIDSSSLSVTLCILCILATSQIEDFSTKITTHSLVYLQ